MQPIDNLELITGVDLGLKTLRRQFSSAEVLTFFTVPITLAPAVPGYAYIPRYMFLQKPAGIAYTLAGVTTLQITIGSGVIGGSGLATGLLDSALATSLVMYGPGSASVLFSGSNLASLSNTAMTWSAGGANPAAGNSPLNMLLVYQLFPITFAV